MISIEEKPAAPKSSGSSTLFEARQGMKIGCVEEIAWRAGWIDDDQFSALGDVLVKSGYGDYIHTCLAQGKALP